MRIKYEYEDATDKDVEFFQTIGEFLELHPIWKPMFDGRRSEFAMNAKVTVPEYPCIITVDYHPEERPNDRT